MRRNFGLPPKSGAFARARDAKPLLTLFCASVFGIIGASIAAMSFNDARAAVTSLFHGYSLIAVALAAGFGCWGYIYFAWPRLAAHFTGGDAFSDLLRFYVKAVAALIVLFLLAKLASSAGPLRLSVLLLCISGGAAAAAAFQTVLTFVPPAPPSGDGR